ATTAQAGKRLHRLGSERAERAAISADIATARDHAQPMRPIRQHELACLLLEPRGSCCHSPSFSEGPSAIIEQCGWPCHSLHLGEATRGNEKILLNGRDPYRPFRRGEHGAPDTPTRPGALRRSGLGPTPSSAAPR